MAFLSYISVQKQIKMMYACYIVYIIFTYFFEQIMYIIVIHGTEIMEKYAYSYTFIIDGERW